MVKNSSRSAMVKKAIEEALEAGGVSNVERVKSRECSSDNFDGVQIDVYGSYVPIRPIIDTIAEMDGHGIESLDMIDEDEARVCVFIAYLPEQTHPAFVQ